MLLRKRFVDIRAGDSTRWLGAPLIARLRDSWMAIKFSELVFGTKNTVGHEIYCLSLQHGAKR